MIKTVSRNILFLRLFFVIIILFFVTLSKPAFAHYEGFVYVYLNVSDSKLGGRFEVKLDDFIDRVKGIDSDGDGVVGKQEFELALPYIKQEFATHLTFHDSKANYPIEITGHVFRDIEIGTFALLEFNVRGLSNIADTIDITRESLVWDSDGMQTMLLIETNDKIGLYKNKSRHTLIFKSNVDRHTVNLIGEAPWDAFKRMVREGVIHIGIGFDHILFLLVLLLPAVLISKNRAWVPVSSFRQAFFNVVTVVTLFTVAHSITLTLAAFDLIRLPVRVVESLIALSIIVVAIANIIGIRNSGTKTVVFGLGLIHGLGFANVLAPLGLAQKTLVVSMLAFNVGVEIGQLAIVLLAFPILYILRKQRLYVPIILYGVSLIAIIVAFRWFVIRAFF